MIDGDETRNDAVDRGSETHQITYDPASSAPPSHVLVVGVADVAQVDPLELEPLHDAVDPATIDEFVGEGGLPDVDGRISFAFAGYDVHVHPCGLFEVTPAD
ncbi:hypothetical protein M0R89_18920 (plasmid) [Halorussus limi]|uniref:Halobacterial output domain-containing protein n=1 Tax=Halorussus limi TaxID=2938695 RepID=A0A8U0I0A5_9EURY|nr:HalOD1 output domain-containing protein [Halorussus limi]UPV76607.1 hypothetical protein M0R89_18920 [Halorussus limi]